MVKDLREINVDEGQGARRMVKLSHLRKTGIAGIQALQDGKKHHRKNGDRDREARHESRGTEPEEGENQPGDGRNAEKSGCDRAQRIANGLGPRGQKGQSCSEQTSCDPTQQ